jgi:type VI protein secretion system component VasF
MTRHFGSPHAWHASPRRRRTSRRIDWWHVTGGIALAIAAWVALVGVMT